MASPAHDESAAPVLPVWSPNPEVPLVARLLAYTFGGLMLLTLIAYLWTPQAPDIPPLVSTWAAYRTQSGLTLPYPDRWAVTPLPSKGDDRVIFTLMPVPPGTDIPMTEVQILAIAEPGERAPGYLEIDRANRGLEEDFIAHFQDLQAKYPRQYRGFAWQGTEGLSPTRRGRVFTFTNDKRPVTGGWIIVTRGRYLIRLIAFAPTAGWDAMKVILIQMAQQLAPG